MRVVTWNCRNASVRSRVWDYLLELAPDVALLQEIVGIPETVRSRYASFQGYPVRRDGSRQRFTTAVLVRGSVGEPIKLQGPAPWVDSELNRYAGYLVGVQLQLECGPRLQTICVHGPHWPVDRTSLLGIDVTPVRLTQSRDVWVVDLLWAALSIIKPQPEDLWIIGGDFNTCETFDQWKGGPRGNREYLDRMDQLGLVDCLRHAKRALTPTFRTLGKGTMTAQIDHLFVTKDLLSGLVACDTGSRERVFGDRLSDHLPIVADFTLARERSG